MQATPGQLPPVPRVLDAWYVICASDELKAGAKPIQRALYGDPVVLFRGQDGTPGALLDRCPHRGIPLSMGCVTGQNLQCAYHGWEFDTQGLCKRVPSMLGQPDKASRRANHYALKEQQGFVWMWGRAGGEPEGEPYSFPYADKAGYLVVRHRLGVRGSLHAVAENALDVPHTAFLHGGLFRKDGDRNRIQCVIQRWDDRAECEYIGEPRPEGLVAKILSPSGGVVTHFDRFIMPCVVEVEYSIGEENHIVNAAALTPAGDYETLLYAVVAVRTRIPGALVKPVVQPLALRIFNQDVGVLEAQTQAAERFGHQSYASTEVDLLGPHILRLLHRAAADKANRPDAEPYRAEIEMEV